MLIGFTGTQQGMTQWQKEQLAYILKLKECTEFMHGDCIGADLEANGIAIWEAEIKIFRIFPPDNPKKRAFCFDALKETQHLRQETPYLTKHLREGKALQVKWNPIEPYLQRNKKIVDAANLMIATPKEHKHTVRSGTWSTIRYAWHTKKDIVIIPPIERPEEESSGK